MSLNFKTNRCEKEVIESLLEKYEKVYDCRNIYTYFLSSRKTSIRLCNYFAQTCALSLLNISGRLFIFVKLTRLVCYK